MNSLNNIMNSSYQQPCSQAVIDKIRRDLKPYIEANDMFTLKGRISVCEISYHFNVTAVVAFRILRKIAKMHHLPIGSYNYIVA